MKLKNLFAITAATLAATPALADINVGVIASLTGPAAALGAETRKAVSLFPASVGGEKVNFILLDDTTDPTAAVKNVRKLIGEDKVDAILGPNLISTAVAMADVANAEKTPMISVAPLDVSGDKRGYIFRSEPSADLMVNRVVADMVEGGAKTVGFIGFSDSWGELLLKALTKATEGKMSIVATERYGRADPSVQAQVLKVMSAKPDVVFVGASGTPAAMPQITLRERGYKGKIYQSHGVTSKEFLRVGGKAVEGALIAEVPIEDKPRAAGQSHYGLSRTFRVMFDILTIRFIVRYLSRPLHFFGGIGAAMIALASGLAGWLLLKKLYWGEHIFIENGPMLLFSAVAFLGGIQFLGLGLLGDLFARLYYAPEGREIYRVARVYRSELPKDMEQEQP